MSPGRAPPDVARREGKGGKRYEGNLITRYEYFTLPN